MKDKFLKQQLDMYANAAGLKDEVLAGAYKEMDILTAKREAAEREAFAALKKRRQNRASVLKGAKLVAFAAVFVLIFTLVIYPLISGENGTETELNGYTFTSLSRTFSTLEEIESAGAKFLVPESATATGEYYVFKNKKNGEIYVVAAKYKIMRQNGNVDEVIIISDLKGGLTDYGDLSDGSRIYDSYEDGEYYSYMCQHEDGRVFYVFVISPDRNAARVYEEIIF